ASESLRRRPRGASRHRFLDDFLQFSTPSPSDEQPDADGGVARRHGQNRGGGESCGYAASLGQRKRVAHIPTAETEAARSSLILEGQGQARLHLKFNPSWSYEWGPVHLAGEVRHVKLVPWRFGTNTARMRGLLKGVMVSRSSRVWISKTLFVNSPGCCLTSQIAPPIESSARR